MRVRAPRPDARDLSTLAPAGGPRGGAGRRLDRPLAWLRSHPAVAVAGLAALHAALAALAFMPAPHPGGDNAVYLALAHSLLDGGYHDLYDPATPRHVQFPPGYPLILALGMRLGIASWVGLKALTAAFSVAAVAVTYAWLRRRRRPDAALGVALLVALSPGVVGLSRWELSDVPFWALTAGALLLFERLPRRATGRAAAGAALAAAAYLVRTAGVPLLLAAAAWLLLRRRWAQLAAFSAVAAPPVLAWSLWTRAHGGYASLVLRADAYAPERGAIGVPGLLARAGENAWLYAGRFLPTLLGGDAPAAAFAALAVAVVALALVGWAASLRRAGVTELWVPLYVAMLLVWNPEWAGERLLLPLYPALLYYAGRGLARAWRATGARGAPLAAASATAVLVLVALPGLLGAARLGTACTREYLRGDPLPCMAPAWRDFLFLADHARAALPERAAVLSRKPALFWSVSGVPGRHYPLTRDPAAFLETARSAGARYVVLDDLDQVAGQYLTPLLIRRPQAFCVVRSLGPERATLFGIVADEAAELAAGVDPGDADVTVGFAPCAPSVAGERARGPASGSDR
jgi:hypothetical protein